MTDAKYSAITVEKENVASLLHKIGILNGQEFSNGEKDSVNLTLTKYLAGNPRNPNATNIRLVSSVGRAPVCCARGRGFELQSGSTLRVLK